MVKRKKIPPKVESEVLVKSARRCCLCYGLHGDFSERKGQIAHVDQNRSNRTSDNLVFLCLEHHDAYDSKTSQSKGIRKQEILLYRDILYTDVVKQLPRILEPLDLHKPDGATRFHQFLESLRGTQLHRSCLLNGYEIQKVCEAGFLAIEPFTPHQVQTVAYNLSIGEEALVGETRIHLNNNEPLVLKQGELACVSTREFISMPLGLIGRTSTRASLSRVGLFLVIADSVSTGFRGRLFLVLENRSRNVIKLSYMTTIASIEFIIINLPPATWTPLKY